MMRGRKTGTKESHYTTVVLPPCKICTGESTGYHFGVITCEACKAFFRRALVQKRTPKCKKDGNCRILPKQTKNCSACRLNLCKRLGMSVEGVRKGRFTLALRTQAIVEANVLEGKAEFVADDSLHSLVADVTALPEVPLDLLSSGDSDSASDYGSSSSSVGSPAEHPCLDACMGLVKAGETEYLINDIVAAQELVYPTLKAYFTQPLEQLQMTVYKEFSLKEEIFQDVFGESKSVSTEEHQQVFAETGVDLDDRLEQIQLYGQAMEESIKQYSMFVNLIPGFEKLSLADTSTLMQAAHLEVWFFGNYMLFNKDLGVALCWDGSQSGTKNHMTKFFPAEWIDSNFVFADSLSKLRLTFEEIAILRAIVLTSADRCSVQEKGKVQALQERFLDALRFHLAKSTKTPYARLAKIFDRLLTVRSMNKTNVCVNQRFLKDWGFVVHEFPRWKDMLSYRDY